MKHHSAINNHHSQHSAEQPGKFSIKNNPRIKLAIGLIIISGLILGLFLSLPLTYLFGPQTKILDVTFINPRQALIFWQSDSPTVGYLKTGNNRFWRPTKVSQISEQADVIHTVLLDQLPLDGLYVSPHTEDQSWWHRSPVQLIRYQEETEDANTQKNNPDDTNGNVDSGIDSVSDSPKSDGVNSDTSNQ